MYDKNFMINSYKMNKRDDSFEQHEEFYDFDYDDDIDDYNDAENDFLYYDYFTEE